MGLDWIAPLGVALSGSGFLLAVFLLALRLGALFLLSPILYSVSIPGSVRVLLVVGLAAALALGLPPGAKMVAAPTAGALLEAALAELALGATLALGIFAAFATISMAGRMIDVQIGFGVAQVFDPATRRQIPILTAAFNQVGVLTFFLINGHQALLRGVAYTVDRFPPGHRWPIEAAAPMVIKQMASLVSLGFALAAPVVVCLLLVELALGVIARNLPQMNMLVVGAPLKIILGLVLLAMWSADMGEAMNRIYGAVFRSWEAAFNAVGVR